MRRVSPAWLVALGLTSGCANGGDAGAYLGGGDLQGGGDGASPSADGTVGPGAGQDGGGSTTENDTGSPGTDEGGATGDDGGSSGGDSGGMGEAGGAPCTASNGCSAPTMMGMIAGDESGSALTASGQQPQWLAVDMLEKNSGLTAVPMTFTAVLTSPSGSNFDLYAYLGPTGSTTVECSSVKSQSTNGAGQTDTVTFQWGETGTFANGADDSAMVTIEVRYVSGPCTASDTWSLAVHGN